MIAMTSVTFRKKSVDEVIAICKDNGIEAIEWGGDVHVPAGDIENAKKVREATENAGLSVYSYGSYFWVGKNTLEEFDDVLATAEALGAKYIRIWLGDVSSSKTDDKRFDEYVEELKAMTAKAANKGIVLASEFHNNTYNDSMETARKMMDAIASPFYKTYWQTVTYDDRDRKYLTELRDDIVNVHVFTWNHWGKRYPLKKKAKMWRDYIGVMGKDAVYTIEFVKNDADKYFVKDAKTLHEWLSE